ncbi:hypothetical protein ACLB2K_047292 [Fragaria x ananassa]
MGDSVILVRPACTEVEIVVSTPLKQGLPLSRVIGILVTEGLSIVSCNSAKRNQRLIYTLETEGHTFLNCHQQVIDGESIDIPELQNRLIEKYVPSFATVQLRRRRASTRVDSSSVPNHFPSSASPSNSSFLARSSKTSNKIDLAGKLEFGGLAGERKWSGTLLESARVEVRRRRRRPVANGGTSAL